MFSRFLTKNPFFYVGSIKQSLKILDVSTPTTKNVIKKQYLSLAKKYHPDSSEDKQKFSEKQLQDRFVNINKAYSYLRELSEDDINNFKQKQTVYSKKNTQSDTENLKKAQSRKMTQQQKMRQQSYQYFNQQFKQSRNTINNSGLHQQNKKESYNILNGAPQLVWGFVFLGMILGDWAYKSYRQSQKDQQFKKKQKSKDYQNVFRSISMGNKYGATIKKLEYQNQK